MKTRLLLISLGFFSCMLAIAGQGGPDKYGYVWMDNLQVGGPTYHWVDIATAESRVTGLADDNVRGPYSITTGPGNDFNYYWYPVDQIWIGSNGYIAFNNVSLASVFPPIPDSVDSKHNFISALLTDLTFSGFNNPGRVYLKVTADSVIVSFVQVPFYTNTAPNWTGSNTFQIILDKMDNSITVNYAAQSGSAYTFSDVKGGMENLTGCIGLQPFAGFYPVPLYTIKYYYPTNSTYLVRDGAIRYNGLPFSKGVFLPFPTTHTLTSEVSNMGNMSIAPIFNATCNVKNSFGAVQLTDIAYFNDTLHAQQDSIFDFNVLFDPITTGTYSYTTRLNGVINDAVATNDSVTQEIVVIDTALTTYQLGYCGNIPDVTGISWVDGSGGVGMYFKPPTYPSKITDVQFYILSNFNGVGCAIKIYADDGPGGSPGTLLDSSYATAPTSGAWTILTYNNPVIINSGGFYVGWLMDGLNITMAVDKVPPISHRSYEIISGAWSEYREGLTQDFMIKCDIQKTTPVDVGPAHIVFPTAGDTLTGPTQVSFWLKNYGTQSVFNFPVHYKFASSGTVNQTYAAPILQPGDSVLFNFSVPLSNLPNQSGNLCIWTSLPFDAVSTNDSTCIYITTQTPISVPEIDPESVLTIYPNPFSESCTVDLSALTGNSLSLQVCDMTGRVIREQQFIAKGKFTLERQDLRTGLYVLRIQSTDQQFVRRLVIY